MIEAFFGLGSNIGDRKAFIDEAVVRLARLPGTKVTARSGYYRTAPVGPVAQEWFLNAAVAVTTALTPNDLVAACHAIESDLGRDRSVEISWGPRFIDVDLVAHADASHAGPDLTAPRGEIAPYAFLLAPLAEIAGDATVAGVSITDRLAATDTGGVERLDWLVPALP